MYIVSKTEDAERQKKVKFEIYNINLRILDITAKTIRQISKYKNEISEENRRRNKKRYVFREKIKINPVEITT